MFKAVSRKTSLCRSFNHTRFEQKTTNRPKSRQYLDVSREELQSRVKSILENCEEGRAEQ